MAVGSPRKPGQPVPSHGWLLLERRARDPGPLPPSLSFFLSGNVFIQLLKSYLATELKTLEILKRHKGENSMW